MTEQANDELSENLRLLAEGMDVYWARILEQAADALAQAAQQRDEAQAQHARLVAALREALVSARVYVEAYTGQRGLMAGMAEQELARIDAALTEASAVSPSTAKEEIPLRAADRSDAVPRQDLREVPNQDAPDAVSRLRDALATMAIRFEGPNKPACWCERSPILTGAHDARCDAATAAMGTQTADEVAGESANA